MFVILVKVEIIQTDFAAVKFSKFLIFLSKILSKKIKKFLE